MSRITFTRMVHFGIVLVALIGLLDAIDRKQKDLALVFGVLIALGLVLVLQAAVGRRDVPIRSDLVRWLKERADLEGEELGTIADRALAAARAGFLGEDADDDRTD